MLLAVVVVAAVAFDRLSVRPRAVAPACCDGAAIDRGDRPRSCRRAVRVVLRPHPTALRRRRGLDVPARALRPGVAGQHRPRAHAGPAVGAPLPPDGRRRPRCRGRGRASPTSSPSSPSSGSSSPWSGPGGDEPAGDRRVPPRRGGHHADRRPAPRRRRQSVPALLLPSARRARRPRRRRASIDSCRVLLPAVVVAAMAWWAIKQMPIGVDPVFTRRPRDNGAVPPPALARASRRRRLADGRRRADRRRSGRVVIAGSASALARWRRPTVP